MDFCGQTMKCHQIKQEKVNKARHTHAPRTNAFSTEFVVNKTRGPRLAFAG